MTMLATEPARGAERALAYLGLALTFALLTGSLAFRWVAAERPPLGNMYEYNLGLAWGMTLFLSLHQVRFRQPAVGMLGMSTIFVLLLINLIYFPSTLTTLVPALQANRILGIHVATMMMSYAALSVSFFAAVLYLVQGRTRRFARVPSQALLQDVAETSVKIGVPMLALGIPGSPTAAVLLGGLLIWGLQPGPLLFVEQKDFVWGLIASMYLGNVVGLIIVLTCVPLFAAILRVPFSIIAPIILVACAVGAFTVNNALFDVWLMVVFGVAGYVLVKLGYPIAPLVLALVLGDQAESSFRQSMLLSQGSLSIFWSNGLVATIFGVGVLLVVWPLISWVRERRKLAPA